MEEHAEQKDRERNEVKPESSREKSEKTKNVCVLEID